MPSGGSDFRIVIPARLSSTRLPEKILLPLAGKPLLQHVYEAACASGAREVLIATDAKRVADCCRAFGAEALLTATTHASGTDRVNEVAEARAWPDDAIVVNLQGDEPLMPPPLIAQAARLLADSPAADLATLVHPLENAADWLNPNVVKAVLDANARALYFSRAPIPWQRDGSTPLQPRMPETAVYRHIGLYAYRRGALRRLSALPPAPLERIEALEQLRALWNGMVIQAGVTREPPPRGVDTLEDFRFVEQLLAARSPHLR